MKAKQISKTLSLLVAVCLILGMAPITSVAASPATGSMTLGTSTISLEVNDSGTGWNWDKATATLTLDSGYSGEGIDIQCRDTDNITLELTDDVTISDSSWGIAVRGIMDMNGGSLTIKAGSHTLTVVSSDGDALRAGGAVFIESGTVIATAHDCGINSLFDDVMISGSANVVATGIMGIWAEENVIINTSGTVTANGDGSVGLYASNGYIQIDAGTVTATGQEAMAASGGTFITGGGVTTNYTMGSAGGDVGGNLTVSGATTNVAINGSITGGGSLTVADGTVNVTGTVEGTTTVTGGTVTVNGITIPPSVIGGNLVVQGNHGGNGTSAGPGADGTSVDIVNHGSSFDSISVISGNGGNSGGGNSGGKGGNANLTLTAPVVTVSGDVVVRTGSDGDTGAWCGLPELDVQGTLRAASVTVESTQNNAAYWVSVSTLDVSEDTTITVSGLNATGNCAFGTINIADGKTLTINNANGALVIGTINFTGNGTGRVLIEDASRLGMNELGFFHNPAFDIPAGTVGKPIARIDVSKGVVTGNLVTKPYTFNALYLPKGISINTETGVISGTPTAACEAGTAMVSVTDIDGTQKSIAIKYGAVSAGGGTSDGSDDDSSSGGGGSSGSGYNSSTAFTPANVSQSQATDAAKKAAQTAKADGAANATVNIQNVAVIPLDALQAMAKSAGMPVRFQADTMSSDGKVVDVRITLDPAKATKELNLTASTASARATAVKALFEKWFENRVQVIVLEQSGSFGQPVEIAARMDLTGMDTKNLWFYSYDKATNTYKRIEKPAYWVDANGYLHFTTELAGEIIISDGALVRK